MLYVKIIYFQQMLAAHHWKVLHSETASSMMQQFWNGETIENLFFFPKW